MAGKFENDSPIVQFSFVSFQPINYPAILQYTFVWKMVFPNEDARICNFLTSEICRENLKMIRQLFNSLSFHSSSPKKLSYNFIHIILIHIRDLSIIFLTKVLVFAIFWRNMAGKFENNSPILFHSIPAYNL